MSQKNSADERRAEEERQELERLLARMQRGDPDAVTEFYNVYFQPLLRAAFRLTGDFSTAQDVAQEAILKAINKVGTYVPGNNPRAWLWKILSNTFLDWKRRLRVRQTATLSGSDPEGDSFDPPDQEPTPDERAEAEEKSAAVQAALMMLSDEDRQLITLRHYEGLSLSEIGEVLGIWEYSQVGGKRHRAMKRLRVVLEANWPDLFP